MRSGLITLWVSSTFPGIFKLSPPVTNLNPSLTILMKLFRSFHMVINNFKITYKNSTTKKKKEG